MPLRGTLSQANIALLAAWINAGAAASQAHLPREVTARDFLGYHWPCMAQPPLSNPELDQYFARVEYAGSREPTLAVLHALTPAPAHAIAFENLCVLLRERIELAPEALCHKLVVRRRGGYCFEQNGLFLAVLS